MTTMIPIDPCTLRAVHFLRFYDLLNERGRRKLADAYRAESNSIRASRGMLGQGFTMTGLLEAAEAIARMGGYESGEG